MRALASVVVAVSLIGCAPEEKPPAPTPTEVGTPMGSPVNAMIGAAGGTVKTADGRLTLTIPAGALSADTTLTVQPVTNTAPGGRGLGYQLLPEGQTFAVPVQLTLAYGDDDVSGSAPEFLSWAVQGSDRTWEIQDVTLDKAARTLTVSTPHFSYWSPMTSIQVTPFFAVVKTGHVKRFTVELCSNRPLGRDPKTGESMFGVTCYPASPSFASRVLGPWMVNGIEGGNSTVGTVRGPELVDYTAPAKVPNPETVTLTAKVTSSDGTRTAPLMVLVTIAAAGTSYGGRVTFSQKYGGDLNISGTFDLVWNPTRSDADVVEYKATGGQLTAHYSLTDCDPVDQSDPVTDSSLVLYTSANVAFPRQYHFFATAGSSVTLTCHNPDGTTVTVQRAIGLVVSGGACNPPPFASFTDEKVLTGSESCSPQDTMLTSSWTFNALE